MVATHSLYINGMDCADCARSIEQGVGAIAGVQQSNIHFSAARLDITYDDQLVSLQDVTDRITKLGYAVREPDAALPTGLWAVLPRGWQWFASGLALLLIALTLGWLGQPLLARWLEVAAVIIAGFPIARSGLQALLLSRRLTINLLMTIAAIGAMIIGETIEAATVIVLFAFGEMLESYTIQRGRDSLRSLLQITPDEATILDSHPSCGDGCCGELAGGERRIATALVQVGDTVLVRPGERVPLDGTVLRGQSAVDQRAMTGESIPVPRGPGEPVFAGSVNGSGALEISVTAIASDSLMSRVAALVEEAQTRRAPVERQIDRFAAVYTPAVLVLALLVATIPPLMMGQPFWDTADGHGWLYRALALLIAACPCALVISTPVSIVSALTAAMRAGILVKGGAVLETLRSIRVVAFDKTGTLTQGKPLVTGVYCADQCCPADCDCAHCTNILALADAIERRSAHPLAHAVTTAAAQRTGLTRYAAAEDVDTLIGHGISGRVNGHRVTVGNHALFDAEHSHPSELCERVEVAESRGQTTLMVCDCEGGGVQGYITVADTPRPESQHVVAELRSQGLRTVMLTGDNASVGAAVAQRIGIDEHRASLLPADKLAVIEELRRNGSVAMVGDGINDTPALVAADVGIAMGAGSGQALEAADVTLMHNDLTRLPLLLGLSQRTGAIIRQNIAISLITKLVFVFLALGGWATLWLAVLVDVGTSLIVTLNGMRLGRSTYSRGQGLRARF